MEAHVKYLEGHYADACKRYNRAGYYKSNYEECLTHVVKNYKKNKDVSHVSDISLTLYENMDKIIAFEMLDNKELQRIKDNIWKQMRDSSRILKDMEPLSKRSIRIYDPVLPFLHGPSKEEIEEWEKAMSLYHFHGDRTKLDYFQFPSQFIAMANGLWNIIKNEKDYFNKSENNEIIEFICEFVSERNIVIHLRLEEARFGTYVQGYNELREMHQALAHLSQS